MSPWILVAGVGNVFLGDDAFGCEVVRRLEGQSLPETVRVIDYGVGGIHLAYDLLDGWDLLILVDTVGHDGEVGEVVVMETDGDELGESSTLDAHSMDPATVFATLRTLEGEVPPIYVIGCQPADTEERLGLSAPVEAAVAPAVTAVMDLVTEHVERDDGNAEAMSIPTRKEE